MKAHLLSQVLLKRFAVKNKVKLNIIKPTSSYLKTPKELAYIDLDEKIFEPIESKYGYIETRMSTAFNYLDDGSLLKHPKQIESVKKFIALHYVRSVIFHLLIQKEPETFKSFLNEAIFSHPEEKSEIEKNQKALRNELRKKIILDMPVLIRSLINKVDTHIEKYDIEVGIAPSNLNFLIGDIAVLTRTQDGAIGVLAGAAVTNSIALGMPLGPKHIVALKTLNTTTSYKNLSATEVSNCNEKLLKQCYAEYYSRPE